MTKALERRIARLESLVPNSAEAARADRILLAFDRVRNPELATEEDREIAAAEDWERVLIRSIRAAGGLAAVVTRVEEERKKNPPAKSEPRSAWPKDELGRRQSAITLKREAPGARWHGPGGYSERRRGTRCLDSGKRRTCDRR